MKRRLPVTRGPTKTSSLVLKLAATFFFTFLIVGLGGVLIGERVLPRFVDFAGHSFSSGNQLEVPVQLIASSLSTYLRIKARECLDPKAGKDFLVVAWFSLKRLPEQGERLVLFGKFERKSSSPQGYALALERNGESIRPVVYWHGGKGKAQWHHFAEVKVLPSSWFLVALSFTKGKYLGLHFAYPRLEEKPEVVVLGGVDLSAAALPSSTVPLQFGGIGTKPIRGAVGPIGVFQKHKIELELKKLIREFARAPVSPPSEFSSQETALWLRQKDTVETYCQAKLIGARKVKSRAAKSK